MAATTDYQVTAVLDLGSLLDAGEGAVVTVVAGETRLAAHRAVLAAGSPVFAAMFRHDTLEASSGEVTIPDVEGPVLRQLLAYLYTRRVPQLPGMAPQVLAAADKYGVTALKDACEQQVGDQLTLENAAAAAVLAVQHSCQSLVEATLGFIKSHTYRVMATKGWADAVHHHPADVVEVSRLLAELSPETSARAATDSSAAPAATPAAVEASATAAAVPAATTPPDSDLTPPPDDAAVSRLRNLSAEERDRRLIQAAKEGELQDVRVLLATGADVEAKDEEGMNALHRAATNGSVEVVRCLLQSGAGVDAKTTGWLSTPLHLAVYRGHTAVVRLLLASSADHGARNKYGLAPLHAAVSGGHTGVATALLEAGADRAARDNQGRTALAAAREKHHQQLVDILE